MDFYKIKIKQITETADTVTIDLDVPAELKQQFSYKQGQHITVKTTINGKELRRAYSMSSSPLEHKLSVTVKKVEGGKVSSWLHDEVKVGDFMEVAPPDGLRGCRC